MDVKSVVKTLETITKNPFRRTKTGWLGLCPVHKDNNPSLSVSMSRDDNFIILNCFAGCDYKDILKAIDSKNCFYDPSEVEVDLRPPWERTPLATYSYKDENGHLLFQKLRFKNKTFAVRRPANKGWRWSLDNVEPVIYNLPQVKKAKVVAIVEGEKDADTITKLGIVGTTNFNGAYFGKWPLEYNKWFHNKHILVFADNDSAGIAHARYIYINLPLEVLSKTWMHPLPGLGHKQDITDWVLMGNGLEEIRELWLSRADHHNDI